MFTSRTNDVTRHACLRGSAHPEVTTCRRGPDIGDATFAFPAVARSPRPSRRSHDHLLPRQARPHAVRVRATRRAEPCVGHGRECEGRRGLRAATAGDGAGIRYERRHGTRGGASTAVAATPSPLGARPSRPTRADRPGGALRFLTITRSEDRGTTVSRRRRRRAHRVEDTRLPPPMHVVVARRRGTHMES